MILILAIVSFMNFGFSQENGPKKKYEGNDEVAAY